MVAHASAEAVQLYGGVAHRVSTSTAALMSSTKDADRARAAIAQCLLENNEPLIVACRATGRLFARMRHADAHALTLVNDCLEKPMQHPGLDRPWPFCCRELRARGFEGDVGLVDDLTRMWTRALSTPMGARVADVALAVLDPLPETLTAAVLGDANLLQLILRALPWADARLCTVATVWRDAWCATLQDEPSRPTPMRAALPSLCRRPLQGSEYLIDVTVVNDASAPPDGGRRPVITAISRHPGIVEDLHDEGDPRVNYEATIFPLPQEPPFQRAFRRVRRIQAVNNQMYCGGDFGIFVWRTSPFCGWRTGAHFSTIYASTWHPQERPPQSGIRDVQNMAFSPCQRYLYALGRVDRNELIMKYHAMTLELLPYFTIVGSETEVCFEDIAATANQLCVLTPRAVVMLADAESGEILRAFSLRPALQPSFVRDDNHHRRTLPSSVRLRRLFCVGERLFVVNHAECETFALVEVSYSGEVLQSVELAPPDWHAGPLKEVTGPGGRSSWRDDWESKAAFVATQCGCFVAKTTRPGGSDDCEVTVQGLK